MRIRGTEIDNIHFSGQFRGIQDISDTYRFGHVVVLGSRLIANVSNTLVFTSGNFENGLGDIDLVSAEFDVTSHKDGTPLLVKRNGRSKSDLRILFSSDLYKNLAGQPQITRIKLADQRDMYDIRLLAVGLNPLGTRNEINAVFVVPSNGYYEFNGEWYSLEDDSVISGQLSSLTINLFELSGILSGTPSN